MNRYDERPELGELTPGQKVVVYRSHNDMRGRKPEERAIPAEVVKAARVWVDIRKSGENLDEWSIYRWRMRRDTQDEATQYSGSNCRFATLDQFAWDETQRWARGYLREQGIELRRSGPWTGREVELADIISKGTDRTEAL
jgi:hypothetical protein